jgi:protein TonB
VNSGTKLLLALAGSVAFHVSAGAGLVELSRRPPKKAKSPPVTVSVVEKKRPPPPEPKPPEPEKPKPPPPPKPVPMKLAKAQPPPRQEQQQPPPTQVAPPTNAPPPPNSTAAVVSNEPPMILPGITLESTASGGSFAVPVGNTLHGDPGKKGRDPVVVKPYKAEVYAPAASVSELPVPLNRDRVDIRKYYPPEALKKEFEGQVVLRLLIDSDGSIAKVEIVSDPGEGLGAAAARAVREFRFAPGKVNGVPVATTVPFTITFVIN